MIGSGSVLARDVPGFALIVGTPANTIGWVSEAGKRLYFDKKGVAFCDKSNKKNTFDNEKVVEID